MSGDFISDGMTRVAYVAAIGSPPGPTTTELGLGILLQQIITADGLVGFEVTSTAVDNTALNSTFDTSIPGRDSYSGTKFTLKKQAGTDTVFATLVKNAAGFIVIRRDVAEGTAWTTGQALEVYPAIFGQRRRLTPSANMLTKWEVDIFISATPSLTAVIA